MSMEYKLEELFDLQMGKTPSRNNSEYWASNDYKWISIGDLSKCGKYISETKEYLSDRAVAESGISLIPANTVIMSFKLSIGKTAITSEPMYSNEAIMAFLDKGTVEILPDYLYYMFSGKNWDSGTNKAVMGKTLNKATLSNIKIKIDDIDRQNYIVNLLDKLTDLIDKRKKQLEKLDELVKARFVEMFGDPVVNEHNWKRLTLGDVCEIGSSKRVFEKDYVTSGIPFFRTKEIVELSKGNRISTELFITEEHFKTLKYSYGVPQKDDLLISAVGTIGTIWIVNGDFDFYFKDGNLIQIKSSSKFSSVYMKYLLDILIANYKQEMSTGTAYSALTISGLKKMMIYDVPLEIQNKFADFVGQVEKLKTEAQKGLERLELLKSALMQEYFG